VLVQVAAVTCPSLRTVDVITQRIEDDKWDGVINSIWARISSSGTVQCGHSQAAPWFMAKRGVDASVVG
jgi:hypothetical protein